MQERRERLRVGCSPRTAGVERGDVLGKYCSVSKDRTWQHGREGGGEFSARAYVCMYVCLICVTVCVV